MITNKEMLVTMNKLDISYYPEYKIDRYQYNGINVPRVTEILSSMLHVDELMSWSNYLGFKRQNYKKTLEEAAKKGTYVHDFIEDFIKHGVNPDFDTVDIRVREEVITAFNSFLEWWEVIKKTNYRVIMQEEKLVCPWFGGTLDLLIEINGKIYLMDFKTSNHPSFKYFLQLAAYRYMLYTNYNIILDGCGILMLNKKEVEFNEIIVDISTPEGYDFIQHCELTFMSIAFGFLNRSKAESMFKDISK